MEKKLHIIKAEGENSEQSPIIHKGRQVTRAELTQRNNKIFRFVRQCLHMLPGKLKLALLVFRAGQMSRCCAPGTALMWAQAECFIMSRLSTTLVTVQSWNLHKFCPRRHRELVSEWGKGQVIALFCSSVKTVSPWFTCKAGLHLHNKWKKFIFLKSSLWAIKNQNKLKTTLLPANVINHCK